MAEVSDPELSLLCPGRAGADRWIVLAQANDAVDQVDP